jgi:glycosyltransferase involved in cell wall biosynthesis
MLKKKSKIVFLNQMAGPLFRELAEDAADFSWFHYFFNAFIKISLYPSETLLVIVSNPPFLGLLGLFFNKLRQQKYVILVYDIYPDLLIEMGRIKKGVITRCWDYLNRLVYKNSTLLISIGHDMAARLERKFDVSASHVSKPICIPPWVDIESIKPIPKNQNWFAQKYGMMGKTTVLYSGNMGHTHDIEFILETAKKLSNEPEIQFVFIGEGAKRGLVQETIDRFNLKNITLLPFQSEDVLPYSMSCGDMGIVAYQNGTQGCMIPSKTFYYMAAGLVPLIISNIATDLTSMVGEKDCGIWIKNNETDHMVNTILELHRDKELLTHYKKSARKTVEMDFSRKNSSQFIEVLEKSIFEHL